MKAVFADQITRRDAVAAVAAAAASVLSSSLTKAERVFLPSDFGVVGDGESDDTEGLRKLFENGGTIRIPAGNYLIAGKGPNAGGVYVDWRKSFHVSCDPGARFFCKAPGASAEGLDNDMFRFVVPAKQAARGDWEPVSAVWEGGQIDQSEQLTSQVVPLGPSFKSPGQPQRRAGSSRTCDGISIRGSLIGRDGVRANGVEKVVVRGVNFFAGEHWAKAGGDSGLFVGSGCDNTLIENCVFTGHRDSGCYGSRDGSGVAGGPIEVRSSEFKSCFFPITLKRATSDWIVSNNRFANAVIAIQTSPTDRRNGYTVGGEGGLVTKNQFFQCKTILRLDFSRGAQIIDNDAREMGAVDAAFAPVSAYKSIAIILRGASNNVIRDLRINGISASYVSRARGYTVCEMGKRSIESADGSREARSNANKCENVTATNWHGSFGGEQKDGADSNSFIRSFSSAANETSDEDATNSPTLFGSNSFSTK